MNAKPEKGQDPRVAALRRALEEKLDRELAPGRFWWPLVVALAGALLGLALLVGLI
ncbi:MAG: hypothetical protein V1750_05420 [Acidobacteriota bacterium]